MASRAHPVLPCLDAMEPERPPPALVSELLEEIFLRVASPADLACASAACVSFRRLIADHSFLRRYRSIHPPLLLGFVNFRCSSFLGFHCYFRFHPVEALHPSAAVARAVALTADFSFDFIPFPTRHQRYLRDIRDGRVLFEFLREEKNSREYWDLVVCDPLSRRYVMLPPITDDLLASVDLEIRTDGDGLGALFIPSGGIEEDTSFSVIRWMQSPTMLGVFVFSSVSGCWSVSMSTNWNDLGLSEHDSLGEGQYVYDCFYWKVECRGMLIKLDLNTMRFCSVDLPSGHDVREIFIVESGESNVAMFSLRHKGTSVDYYTFSQNDSEKSHEWHMMRTIPLPAHYTITIMNFTYCCPTEGYILIECLQDTTISSLEVFSLEVKSFNIERVIGATHAGLAYPYFGFPPSMSPRRIQGYGEVESDVLRLEQLKASKMKDLVLKKKTELEDHRRCAHLIGEEGYAAEFSTEATEAAVDPALVLEQIESHIATVKEETFSRKDILEKVERWLNACEEEAWLEDYNKDDNRYNAGRGAHLTLKRAEKARILANKIPGMVDVLTTKIHAWEKEREKEFTYDGVRLLSMLEEYMIIRQEKELEKKRQRDQKKIQGQIKAEQEALYGSKPSSSKPPSTKKTPRNSMGGANRWLSLGVATMQAPKTDILHSKNARAAKKTEDLGKPI